jgi:hypothetical protein
MLLESSIGVLEEIQIVVGIVLNISACYEFVFGACNEKLCFTEHDEFKYIGMTSHPV